MAKSSSIGIGFAFVVFCAALGVSLYFLFKPKDETSVSTTPPSGSGSGSDSGSDSSNNSTNDEPLPGKSPNPNQSPKPSQTPRPSPTPFPIGQTVVCNDEGNPNQLYRYVGGDGLRVYNEGEVVKSYFPDYGSANWKNNNVKTIRCSSYAKGAPMGMKMDDGQTVSCNNEGNAGNLYRFTNGRMWDEIRNYPSYEIGLSYFPAMSDPNWASTNVKYINSCKSYLKGDNMPMNPR